MPAVVVRPELRVERPEADWNNNLAERLRKTVEALRIRVEEEPPVKVTV